MYYSCCLYVNLNVGYKLLYRDETSVMIADKVSYDAILGTLR
jgi:hypothetical protein